MRGGFNLCQKPVGLSCTAQIAIDALIKTGSGPRFMECARRNGHKFNLHPYKDLRTEPSLTVSDVYSLSAGGLCHGWAA